MDKTELEDFKKHIEQQGFDINDFQLKHLDKTEKKENEIMRFTGQITVKRKSTKKEKTYRTGTGTSWVIEFYNDLDNKFYN